MWDVAGLGRALLLLLREKKAACPTATRSLQQAQGQHGQRGRRGQAPWFKLSLGLRALPGHGPARGSSSVFPELEL